MQSPTYPQPVSRLSTPTKKEKRKQKRMEGKKEAISTTSWMKWPSKVDERAYHSSICFVPLCEESE
jgi:hypothetical protein